MPRTLTIAALLPALGAAPAAWAQDVPQAPSPQASASAGRALSWTGRAAARPPAQAAAYPAVPADGFAPVSAARPTVIPHGGYPWRAGAPDYSRQLTPARTWGAPSPIPAPPPSANALTPAPDFRPTTSQSGASWGPYVNRPEDQPAPVVTTQPPPRPAPWTRQPLAAQPQPSAVSGPAPQPREAAPTASRPPRPHPQTEPQTAPEPSIQPAPEPLRAVQPQPAPSRPTQAQAQPQPQTQAQQAPAPERIPERAPAPSPQPVQPQVQPPVQPPVQPAPQPVQAEPAPAPVGSAVDPMAPRRDAPIFQLQRSAPQPPAPSPAPSPTPQSTPRATSQATPQTPAQNPAQNPPQGAPQAASNDTPAQGGARYYSVHRQAGRQPDATPLPAPSYLDAMPVELNETPSSTDLAQPPEPPAVLRDAQGRLRAAPMSDDPMTNGPMLP